MKTVGLILAGVAAAVAVNFFFFGKQGAEEYSMVYLSTGEIYVGRLSTFPRLTLTDGYIFRAVPDPTDPKKTTFQLSSLKDQLWGPQYLYLNKDHVLFSGPLDENSTIFKKLQNPTSNPPSNPPATNVIPTGEAIKQ
jgi:hypothetical protein